MAESFSLIRRIQGLKPRQVIGQAKAIKAKFDELGLSKVVDDLPLYDAAIRRHPGYPQMLDAMVSALEKHAASQQTTNLRLLELGPGTGTLTEQMLKRLAIKGYKIHLELVEPDDKAAAYTQEKIRGLALPNVTIGNQVHEDLLNVTEGAFDAILGSFSFHHISDDNKLPTLERICQLKKKSGILILGEEFVKPYQTPNQRKKSIVEYHRRILSELLTEYGQTGEQPLKDMALIESLAMVNGLVRFDEAKISFTRFKQLAEQAGLKVIRYYRFFPSSRTSYGVSTVVLR